MTERVPPSRLPQRGPLHACPHPGCPRDVPGLMWACFEHWQALPATLRQGIWAATRRPAPGSLQLQNAEERAFAFWGAIERELREIAAGDPSVSGSPLGPPRSTA